MNIDKGMQRLGAAFGLVLGFVVFILLSMDTIGNGQRYGNYEVIGHLVVFFIMFVLTVFFFRMLAWAIKGFME